MTIAAIARRLADLEARLEPLRPSAPGAPPPWLAWASRGELLELETLLEPIEADERDPTEVDQLLALEIEARATRRMLAGEPPASPLLPGRALTFCR